ncbi:MAG: nucleoside kinase [Lachnospiraceae bacterium]|nr:nucleoside kinase [Lachnospiraceae bacterium]
MEIKIKHGKAEVAYEAGTSLRQIADDFQMEYKHPIVLASVNGKLHELHRKMERDAVVEFLTTGSKIGNQTVRRSMVMLFVAACWKMGSKKNLLKTVLHFSIKSGYYFTVEGCEVDDAFVQKLETLMRDMVDRGCRINKMTIPTDEAILKFAGYHMADKEKLFRTRLNSSVNIYNLDGYEDYNYGYMTYDTSILGKFSLHRYHEGIVMMMPTENHPDALDDFLPDDKLFQTRISGKQWAGKLEIDCVGDLNERIVKGGVRQVVLVSEAMQEGHIAGIAKKIKERGGIKFVMIAGPSSSGKTTFSQRLITQLMALGFVPHYIGVDNYFIPRDLVPLDEYGQKDFESLRAIDVETFNQDMTNLLMEKEISLPTYDFITGKRVFSGETLSLGRDEILVIEGIHCLNDELSYSLPDDCKFKIYISALTQVNIDEHNRIPSSDGRLLRRIVRDHRTRGYSAMNTLSMWDAVRRGEEAYIFPFQETADEIFNSALPYELSLLKLYAQPLLFQVPKGHPHYFEAHRLLKFMDYFIPIPPEDVPRNSILREFIGGGCYRL